MWLSEVEGTSYALLISVLIILGLFAILVFGSLPCSCRYILLLSHCLWRKKNRVRVGVTDTTNRIHVIGSGRLFPDPESLIQFPVYPFATAEPHGHYPPSGHHQQSLRLVHHVSQLPCYHEYAQNQLKFPPARWEDEPPPAYDLLFPSGTSSESGNPTPGDNNSKCQPRPV